jgi:hypothetical protein
MGVPSENGRDADAIARAVVAAIDSLLADERKAPDLERIRHLKELRAKWVCAVAGL